MPRHIAFLVGVAFARVRSQEIPTDPPAELIYTDVPTTTVAPTPIPDQEPLCGYSKRDVTEDPVRRYCLRQCILDDTGVVNPPFADWEEYCRATAGMSNWDPHCQDYLCCTFGCEIWGSDQSTCRNIDPIARYDWLLETKANMYSTGLTQAKRCTLLKCHSYCAKVVFQTCRETQWAQSCEAGHPELYGCDVDCSSAWRQLAVPVITKLLVLVSFQVFL